MSKAVLKSAIVLIGPTATGKTDLSIHLSKALGCEIVSADSRQIYKYMNIGTAKPTEEEQAGVPHYCLDMLEPDSYFSAGEYAKVARFHIHNIYKRQQIPLIVGGSGLYIRALLDGVFEGNYRDEQIREKLKEELRLKGNETLHRELARADPEAAERIHPSDEKRLLRALEVYRISGKPISKLQKEQTIAADFPFHIFGLRRERSELYNRINERVDRMISDGLVEEVKGLRELRFNRRHNAMDSVGYKEVLDYLDCKIDLYQCSELIKQNTRRFAKKQITWFKRDQRIHWIDIGDEQTVQTTAEQIILQYQNLEEEKSK